MTLIKEGETKKVFSTDSDKTVLIKFKDLLNNAESNEFVDLTTRINSYMFSKLAGIVSSQFVRSADFDSFFAKKVEMVPLTFFLHNFVAGSLAVRNSYNVGEWFPYPFLEYIITDEEKGKQYVGEPEVVRQEILNYSQIDVMVEFARKANQALWSDLRKKNLYLIDVKLKFGWDSDRNIILADEITPYNCRFWLRTNGGALDFDIYRDNPTDPQKLLNSYRQIAEMLGC